MSAFLMNTYQCWDFYKTQAVNCITFENSVSLPAEIMLVL